MKIAFFEIKPQDQEYFESQLKGHELLFFPEKLSAENVEVAKDCEVVSVFVGSEVPEAVVEKLPNLKLISTRSTGFDHIDVVACKKRGVVVSNVSHYGENTVAEHTFGLMLDLSRKIHQSIARVKQEGFSFEGLTGFDLKGRTLGIVGLGHIGQHVARIANGFEMKVLAYDSLADKTLAKKLNVEFVDLETLLKTSDIVSLHLPENKDTHHILNAQNIGLMKKGAYLINTARGGLVETDALVKALENGTLAGAGLDVLEEERAIKEEANLLDLATATKVDFKTLLENHILMERDNVIVTPHNAFNSKEALERILQTTAETIKAFGEGKTINIIS